MGPNRDGVWKETGLVEKFPKGGPKRLWAEKIHGGYAGPAVADGRVYVHDYKTDADVRKESTPIRAAALKGKERVLCLDAKTGKELWKYEYDCPYKVSYPAGPRCTPTVHDGKVYTLGAMGDLYCLDAKKGTKLWHVNFVKDYDAPVPMWGFCSHPLIDGKNVVCQVGGKGQAAVAWDKDKGTEVWKAAVDSKDAGYAPVAAITAGGKKQLLIFHPEGVASVNPADGKEYWSVELTPNHGMSIMTPQKSGDYLFAGGYGKSVLLELGKDKPGAKPLWRGKERSTGLFPVNGTPLMEKDTMYGVDQPGQLRAVDVKTGKWLWSTTKPVVGAKPASSGTAFLVKNGDRHFLFNEKGELIIARLTRDKYEEIDRVQLLKPTNTAFGDRDVVWSHPAFANKCVFARNDKEIVCYSLAK
jgi:outer membrane protein assembly factor BamB